MLPKGMFGKCHGRTTPYIFSNEEICSLMKEATKLYSPDGLRRITIATAIGLLWGTENIDIDSILNFKIQEAAQQKIKIALDLSIPEKMSIASFDLAIILGNLLDNAIEAVAEMEKERQIKTKINYDKGRLIILVENPYQGERVKVGNQYLTTNKESSQHGLGLENVKSVLQKYDGTMDITQRGNIFSVSLLLFV
jgi:sensor histidine kinase regulating citrate/malate metabolism